MKKRMFITLMAVLLAASMLTGCFKLPLPGSNSSAPESGSSQTGEESRKQKPAGKLTHSKDESEGESSLKEESESKEAATEGDDNTLDQEAYQVYTKFLRGEIAAATIDRFAEDEAAGKFTELPSGTYTFAGLTARAKESMMNEGSANFALVDFGDDGIRQLVLRFVSFDSSFLNVTYVLSYIEDQLYITACYLDGYRTTAELYTNGYLYTGGSSGAGMYGESMEQFDQNGEKHVAFVHNEYQSSWCTSAGYSFIREDQWETYSAAVDVFSNDSYDSYDSYRSTLAIELYVNGEPEEHSDVFISVSGKSDDSSLRSSEEALIEVLRQFGAVEVSPDEMAKLTEIIQNKAAFSLVSFEPVDDWSDVYRPPYSAEQSSFEDQEPHSVEKAEITIYFTEEELVDFDNFTILTIDENADMGGYVVISSSQEISDLKVYAIEFSSVDADGISVFSIQNKVGDAATVKPFHPVGLLMGMVGSIPNIGFSYIDTDGQEEFYAIGMSGYNGSLYAEKIRVIGE